MPRGDPIHRIPDIGDGLIARGIGRAILCEIIGLGSTIATNIQRIGRKPRVGGGLQPVHAVMRDIVKTAGKRGTMHKQHGHPLPRP